MNIKLLATLFAIFLASLSVSAQDLVWINGNNVNLRESPSTTGKKVGTAVKGMVFENAGSEGDWTKLKDLDGSTKYISSKFVTALTPEQRADFTTDMFVIIKDGIIDYSVGKNKRSNNGQSEEGETWRFMKEEGKPGIIAEKEWFWANTSGMARANLITYRGEDHGWYVVLTHLVDPDENLEKLEKPIYAYACLATDGVIIDGELLKCNSNLHTDGW